LASFQAHYNIVSLTYELTTFLITKLQRNTRRTGFTPYLCVPHPGVWHK